MSKSKKQKTIAWAEKICYKKFKKTEPKLVIKAWAVVWLPKVAEDYGVKPYDIIALEPVADLDGNKYKVRCRCHAKKGKKTGWHYIDGFAVFETEAEAESYRGKNNDWKSVRVEIKILD